MKKVVRILVLLLVMVSIPSFSYAQNYNKNDIPNGSYVIGTYMFTKEKNANYNGTLTTQMIMLASKSIQSNKLTEMIIYYKNSRGKWINAINNQSISNVPNTFEITCKNMSCQHNINVPAEAFDTYTNGNVGSGSYIIGTYLFDKNKNSNYNGTLTTQMIMLASKSIQSNILNDMKIYYKNSRGKWINAINNTSISSIPATFNITYVDLVKKSVAKKNDKINFVFKSVVYTGNQVSAFVTSESGLNVSVEYYSDSTCQTKVNTPINSGKYYIKASTSGNDIYNSATLGCSEAIEIKKATLSCPNIIGYNKNYDKSAHSITVGAVSNGTIQYKTTDDWTTTKPKRTNAGKTTVYVRVLGDTNYETIECGSADIKINKINDDVSVLSSSFVYDGSEKIPKTIHVVSGLTPNITYYTDSTCKTKTTTAQANTIGGAPIAVGTYYLSISTSGNTNYNSYGPACFEAVTITEAKADDVLYIEENISDYTGNQIGTFYGSKSSLDPSVTYYTDSSCKTKTPAIGNLSAGHAPIDVGVYYVIASTPGDENYNPTSSPCTKGVTINKRTVTITAPKASTGTLTYNGYNQALSGQAGSCSAGGVMYYYKNNYTSSTAPEFDTTNWTTTYPTATGKNAGTYYMWYYCKVDDTANNKGTGINTAKSITKKIVKKTPELNIQDNYTINSLESFALFLNDDSTGKLSCTSSNTSYATCSVGNSLININNTYEGTGSQTAVITVTREETDNYNAVSKSFNVKVFGPPIDVTNVVLNKTSGSLSIGEKDNLVATIEPDNADDKTITWSSSDTSVATVSSKGVVTAKKAGLATITATSSNGKKAKYIASVKDNPATLTEMQNSYILTEHSLGSGYYTYSPSVFIDNNNNPYIFSCSNKDSYVTRDHIYLNTTGNFVLTPTSGWDSYHNCDPSVVQGNFKYNGKTYKYVMAYTGIDNDGLNNSLISNRIGFVVSNNLTSGWEKISPSPFVDTTVTDKWGVGQPSLIYVNNKLILFYTNSTGEGKGMQFKIINPDGFIVESEGNLSTTGTTWMHNADFAYKDNRLYVAFEGSEHRESDPNYNDDIISNTVQIYSAYIYDYTAAKAYKNLSWEKENEINSNVSGQARNSNAGLFKKASGELFDRRVAFTATNSGKGDGHFSYEIYQSKF